MWRRIEPVQVQILLFATLKDTAGTSSLTLSVPGDTATIAEVRRALVDQQPRLATGLGAAIAALNEEYASDSDVVKSGDTIAFFPPVSGGAAYPEICRLSAEPIDHDALVAAITVAETGAVCLFSGMVRGRTVRDGDQRQTERLHYEAYESMAVAKMHQVTAEIRQRWPLVQGIAIVQRVGTLEVGQNTIVIACSSAHRDEGCFEAARYGIDRLKEIVPVWKREISPDGTTWIEGSYYPSAADRQDG
jgi:molybdopterin synthase catalytic subunit